MRCPLAGDGSCSGEEGSEYAQFLLVLGEFCEAFATDLQASRGLVFARRLAVNGEPDYAIAEFIEWVCEEEVVLPGDTKRLLVALAHRFPGEDADLQVSRLP